MRRQVIKTFRPYIRGLRRPAAAFILFSLLLVPLEFVGPAVFAYLIDHVMWEGKAQGLFLVGGSLIGAFLLRIALETASQRASNQIQNRFVYRLRHDLWKKIIRMDPPLREAFPPSDLKMRLFDDVSALGNFLKEQLADYIFCWLLAGAGLLVCFLLSWKLTLFCLAVLPAVMLLDRLAGRGMGRANETIRVESEAYYSFLYHSLHDWREVKVLGLEDQMEGEFCAWRDRLAALGYRFIRFWGLSEVLGELKLNYLTKTLVFLLGAVLMARGEFSVGTLMMFSQCYGLLFQSLDTINKRNASLPTAWPYITRIRELLGTKETRRERMGEAGEFHSLCMEKVSFSYGDFAVLRDIDFSLRRGDFTAIAGKSGGGKSTLIKLLLGLYPPERGTVSVNGREGAPGRLWCTAVMQDSSLFHRTIRENLLFGDVSLHAKVEALCRPGGLLDFVHTLPGGLDTDAGESGSALSGGQRQRVLIARALLRESPVLILDESTASLDTVSEREIMRQLEAEREKRTLLVISHRPEVLKRAGRLFFLEEGSMREESPNKTRYSGEEL